MRPGKILKKMKIGDRVEVLDDTVSGVVVAINGDRITIETEDGFPMHYKENELVMIKDLTIKQDEIDRAIKDKKAGIKKKRKSFKRRFRQPPMEVDLHIQELTPHV